ncbi:glyoxalase [Chryseobacterium shandongense]|uniref:Glyoxalase n=1 Tax=Chryseobacterium shandongense TaxID=1493872 RepID=A0AAD1DPG0_9FLAO|nr:glyoxalase [Chryseobacterium shandongense]AZA88669.1 glyoxalase [Chryseobacterium shandongense]AZA97210.1 glyoxalase [Chryseobacterium shandongense]
MPDKTDLREQLSIPVSGDTSDTQAFQSKTLRPILKLQNEIYHMLFQNYAVSKISDFNSLTTEKKLSFIDQSLRKDHALRNIFIGMTVGMLTAEEMKTYIPDKNIFNKRIITMITERLKSQMEK